MSDWLSYGQEAYIYIYIHVVRPVSMAIHDYHATLPHKHNSIFRIFPSIELAPEEETFEDIMHMEQPRCLEVTSLIVSKFPRR